MTDTPRSNHGSISLADLRRALAPDRCAPRPSDEAIVAYHHGELPEERIEEVRTFLASDPSWGSALEDARDPEALAAQSGVEDEAIVDAAWQDFQSRLGEVAERFEPGKVVGFPKPTAPVPSPTAPSRWWLIAAVFFVGTILGAFFGRWMFTALGHIPESNVRLVELEPLRPEAGPLLGAEDTTTFTSMGSDLIVLKLWPPTILERDGDLPAEAPFRVSREAAAEHRGKAELQDGAYVASLPVASLESGEYWIELDLGSGGISDIYQYELRWQVDWP